MNTYNRDHNRAVWFDIPVIDLDRATFFYAAVLGVPVTKETYEGFQFSLLTPGDGNGGCLVTNPEGVAANNGILLYLNTHGRIRDAVNKVKEYGGRVVEEIHSIGPHGYRAIILDSEGNRLALHSEVDT